MLTKALLPFAIAGVALVPCARAQTTIGGGTTSQPTDKTPAPAPIPKGAIDRQYGPTEAGEFRQCKLVRPVTGGASRHISFVDRVGGTGTLTFVDGPTTNVTSLNVLFGAGVGDIALAVSGVAPEAIVANSTVPDQDTFFWTTDGGANWNQHGFVSYSNGRNYNSMVFTHADTVNAPSFVYDSTGGLQLFYYLQDTGPSDSERYALVRMYIPPGGPVPTTVDLIDLADGPAGCNGTGGGSCYVNATSSTNGLVFLTYGRASVFPGLFNTHVG